MGYESQVALTLTPAAEAALRAQLTHADPTVQAAVRQLLDDEATHFENRDHHRLYFWTWRRWSIDDPDVGWLDTFLQELEVEFYCFVRLGEDADDYERDGDDDTFDVHRIQFLDFTPDPDRPNAMSGFTALIDAGRRLNAIYDAAEESDYIDWEDINEVHRLTSVAVRALD